MGCGASTTGKTTLALQILIANTAPSATCIYIHTEEGVAPMRRLFQIAKFRAGGARVDLSGILIHSITAGGPGALDIVLLHLQPQLEMLTAIGRPARVLVVDSVANPFQSDTTSQHRAQFTYIVGRALHEIAVKHRLAVVVTNHVRNIAAGSSVVTIFHSRIWIHVRAALSRISQPR